MNTSTKRFAWLAAAALAVAPALMAANFAGGWFAPHTHAAQAEIGSVDLGAIRAATAKYVNVKAAEEDGYGQFLGCVSGPNQGAMGIHFANGTLVGDHKIDPLKPEVLIYEPRNGRLRLVGLEYVVLAEPWNAANQQPPMVMGQVMHLTGSPNRYGMPAHYSLHVWAWQANPNGVLSDWNTWVSCAP
jgi:hypothetical protein